MVNASSASPAPEKLVAASVEGVNGRGRATAKRRCMARRVMTEEKKKNVAPKKNREDCLRARRVPKAERRRVSGVEGGAAADGLLEDGEDMLDCGRDRDCR